MWFYIDCHTKLKYDIEIFKKMLLLFFWHCKLEKLLKFFRNCEIIFINIVEIKKLASFKIDTMKNENFCVIFVLKFCVDILKFRLFIVDFAKHEVRKFINLICSNLSKIWIEKMLIWNICFSICLKFSITLIEKMFFFDWKYARLKYLFFDLHWNFQTF